MCGRVKEQVSEVGGRKNGGVLKAKEYREEVKVAK